MDGPSCRSTCGSLRGVLQRIAFDACMQYREPRRVREHVAVAEGRPLARESRGTHDRPCYLALIALELEELEGGAAPAPFRRTSFEVDEPAPGAV